MNMVRGVATAIAVALCCAALSGCGPVNIATVETEYMYTPPPDTLIPYGPVAFTEDGLLFLVMGGSSSCHPYPTGIDIEDSGAMTVHIGRPWALACTADSAMVTYRLPVDSVPSEITLISDDNQETLQVVPTDEH